MITKTQKVCIANSSYKTSVFRRVCNELDCSYNWIKGLDLTQMPGLIELNCSYTDVTHLDLSGVPLLYGLRCADTYLEELDISLLNLKYLDCTGISPQSFMCDKGSLELATSAGGIVQLTGYDVGRQIMGLTVVPDAGYYLTEWAGIPQETQQTSEGIKFYLDGDFIVEALLGSV